MSGSGDGLDGLRAQFGIPNGGTGPTAPPLASPQLSAVAGGNSSGGSGPAASGDGIDNLRAQFGIPAAPASSAGGAGHGVQQAAAAGSGGGGGVAGWLGKVASGALHVLPALGEGALQLGKDLGVTALHAGENVVNDVSLGHTHLGPQSGWADHGGVVASQQEITDTLNQRPALRGAVEGMKQTGNEIVHPSRIPQNYGRDPVGSLLNDAANLSMILGPIAETAGAVGAEGRAAGLVGKAADVTHAVATAPLKPFTMAAGKLADLGPIAERLDQMRANRQASDFAAENLKQPARQTVGDVAQAFVPAGQLSADEQAALVLAQRNELGLVRPALDRLSPAERDQFFADQYGKPGSPVSPAAAKLAYEYGNGTLPADQTAKFDGALQSVRENVTQPRQQAALAGDGMAGGARLNPEQAGFTALSAPVDAAAEKAMEKLPKASTLAANLRAKADAASAKLDQAKADLSAALDEKASSAGQQALEQKRASLAAAVERQQQRALTAADRVTSAQDLAEAAKVAPPAPAPQALDVRARRLTNTLDRVDKARADLEAARARVAQGEDRLVTNAEKSVPTVEQASKAYEQATKQLAAQVEQDRNGMVGQYRTAAKTRAEQIRNDMSMFFADGPLGRGQRADWYDNLPSRVKKALVEGAGVTKAAGKGADASLGLGPDEWIAAVRRTVPGMEQLSENQIVDRFMQLYDQYGELRQAAFRGKDAITAQHLRNAGINDPYTESLIGGTPQEVAAYLADQHGITPPDPEALGRAHSQALAGAGDTLMTVDEKARVAAETPSVEVRRQLVADIEASHGADAAKLAGRVYDQTVKERRLPALEEKIPVQRGKLADTAAAPAAKQGAREGVAAERAAQAERIGRLEQRNLASLTGKLEKLPDEADPAAVKPTYGMGKRLGGLDVQARTASNAADRAENVVDRIRGRVQTAAQKAALDPRNAPARLRPMLYAAQDAIKTLTDSGHADVAAEIRPTLEAVRQAGLDADHVIGGTDKTAGAGSGRTAGMLREKPTGAQLRRLGNQTEYTAHGQAGLEVRRAVEGVRNQFAQKVADPANGFVVGADHVDQGANLTGSDLYHAAELQQMVPWDPTKGQPFFPKGQLGNVPPGAVTRTTLFMPKALYDAFAKQEHAIPDPNSLGAKFDRLNTLLRKNPLLLSPTYHLRIATSNAMLAGLQGDLTANPLELARRIGEARDMLKTGTAPRALVRNGMFGDEQALMDLRRAGTDPTILSKFAHGPADVARKLSSQIDSWSRVMSYIGEKSKGYSDAEAVRRANEVIGNYDQASPFEQNVLRRALPIYPWLKQVAKVAGRLGQDHPAATTFMLHMGQLAAQKDDAEGRPSWMRGWYELGNNRFVPTDLLNPFAVAAAPPGGFVSPLVKAPLAALTGLDTKTWQQYTRPPGQPQSGGLWHNPGELGYVVKGMNPLSRFVRDQQLSDVKRYQTGEPKLKAGALQPAGKPAPLLSVLGVPAPETVDLAKTQAAEAKFQRGQQKAGARYQARLKNAQGK